MKTAGKIILIVEDNRYIANSLARILQKSNYIPEIFYTLDGASRYFDTLNESNVTSIAGIIFDYVLDETSLVTSIPLVIKMKRIPNFNGVMLANSSDVSGNRQLVNMGCTHVQTKIDKIHAGADIIKLLR